jgi:6-pyruvoyl-tetrahydropterin synthase
MYAVEVRDHMMIAHSLPDPVFGPAMNVHGATFVVDVAFFREALSEHAIVVDIGRATEALKAALAPLAYRNLDDLAVFAGRLTTTEFLCRHVFDCMAEARRAGRLGPGAEGLTRMRVTLSETPNARAWYEAALDG